MALPACSICGENQPVLVQGDAQTGDQTFVCGMCLPGFMLSAASELTKDMPESWCEAYGAPFDAIRSNDHRPAKPPAAGAKRGRARKPAADGAEPAQEPPLAVPVTLDEPCPSCGGTKATGDDAKLTCDGCGSVLAVVPGPDET